MDDEPLVHDGRFNPANDLGYLIRLAGDALQAEELETDFERAQWAVAQWCQELGYVPDLSEYDTGQMVKKDPLPEDDFPP